MTHLVASILLFGHTFHVRRTPSFSSSSTKCWEAIRPPDQQRPSSAPRISASGPLNDARSLSGRLSVSKANAHLAASSSGAGSLHARLVCLFRLQMQWFSAEPTGVYRSCPNENGAQFADSLSASAYSSALPCNLNFLIWRSTWLHQIRIPPRNESERQSLLKRWRGPDHCGAAGEEPVM